MAGLFDMAQQRAEEDEMVDLGAQYEDAVVLAEQIATTPEGFQGLAEVIAQSDDIAAGIGQAAATLMIQVEQRIELDGAVKMEFIGDILEHVFEIAGEMGLISEEDVTDAMVEQVTYQGVESYAEIKEAMGEPMDATGMDEEISSMDSSGLLEEARRALGSEKLDMLLQIAAEGTKQPRPEQPQPKQQV